MNLIDLRKSASHHIISTKKIILEVMNLGTNMVRIHYYILLELGYGESVEADVIHSVHNVQSIPDFLSSLGGIIYTTKGIG